MGVTHESEKDTLPFIKKYAVEFPYAYDKGAKLMGRYAGGLPTAILIDPAGTVVYKGHPNSLSNSVIESVLGGALKTPLWQWPDSAKAARKAFTKRQFAKALAKAGEDADVEAAIRGVIDGALKGLTALHEEGNYLTAAEFAADLQKQLSGLPEAEQAKEVADAIKGDKTAQKILKAQQKVRKMGEGRIKKGKIPNMIKSLEKIVAEYPDTAAARDAQGMIDALRAR